MQKEEDARKRKAGEDQAKRDKDAADKRAADDAETARLHNAAMQKEKDALEAAKQAAKNNPGPPNEEFEFEMEPATGEQASPPQATIQMPE